MGWAHLVDFNGDGRPDIVAQIQGDKFSQPRLFLNLGGTQSVQFLDVTATYGFPDRDMRFVQAGDFDRDGKMDLITASPLARQVGEKHPTVTMPIVDRPVTWRDQADPPIANQRNRACLAR